MAGRASAQSERASELANAVRRAARKLGRTDLADRVTAEAARWGDAACTIVVLGPPGAGKTQLVNALTGGAAALPVGHGGTTCVTAVRSGDAVLAEITGVDGAPTRVDADDLRRLVTRDGLAGRRAPDAAAITLPAPRLLDGLVLVDTPPIGGVDELGGRRALAAADLADAVVHVVDASAPLGAGDLAVLGTVAQRISSIAVVISKIDRFRGWRRIVDDAGAALATAPSLGGATVLGVSSRLADAAFDPDLDEAEAMELLDDSGLPRLQEHLAAVVRRLRQVRLRNLVATLDLALDELIADQRSIASAATDEGAADQLAQIESARRALADLRDDASGWLVALADAMGRAREDATADLQRRLAELGARCERAIEGWSGDHDALLAEVDRDIALVSEEFGRRFAVRVHEVVQVIADRADLNAVAVEVVLPDLADVATTGEGVEVSVDAARGEPARLRVAGSLVSAATSSSMLLTMLGGGGADAMSLVRIGALGAATVFSGALAAVTVRGDRRNRTRQQLRAELRPRLDAIRGDGPARIRVALLATQRALEAQIKRELRERSAVLEARVASLNAAARADAAERRRRAARAEDELRQLLAHRHDVAALRDALTPP